MKAAIEFPVINWNKFENQLFNVKNITPKHRDVADQCFAYNTDVNKVYVTSDLNTFTDRVDAINHSVKLTDISVVCVKRFENC
ncbi:hypothetical protein [Mucilaginibacter sp.]|uniref:hypothetical protein n=1 Tax=Mucilaginibacter sp. TaxID=1882438 RepID=UPI000CAA90AA|nr:hypothetical protein [Mucilaginibacter sp.]PLW88739.1 MAG: hypothetical protein C0154_15150 [Mucilaginibacter sp.]PMP65690.1 MAG: hypothetical protein C0191_02980 [Mucilaginibacter sp.]HEK20689.1 hypothetical protein [Bacteroidota bacterium]